MKNYEIFPNKEEQIIADRIQRLRYLLLVHSCIYYDMHNNLVEDYQWDRWAKELVELQEKYPDISEQVMLYDYFWNFDGSTGFDLPIREDWVVRIAKKLLVKSGRSVVIKPVKPKKQTVTSPSRRKLF